MTQSSQSGSSGRGAHPEQDASANAADTAMAAATAETVTIPGDGTVPTGKRRWLGLTVLATALGMIVLDGTIVGVALPVIAQDLKLSLTNAQWVNSIYSVVFAALLLSAGSLGDRVGRRNLLVTGVAIFLGGSVLAATSTAAGPLILARVIQGVGGAAILPSTLSTVNATFRGKDRAAAFGVWGAVISGAAAVGPLLGGWLTQYFTWNWIFWINVPLGAVLIIAAYFTVGNTSAKSKLPGVDVDGLQLSALGFGLLVFGLIEGQDLGWWSQKQPMSIGSWTWPESWPISPVPVSLALGVIFIGLFILWERHRARVRRAQLLDLSLFRFSSMAWGNVTAGAVAIGEFALVFVLPLYLVNAVGLNTMGAGWVLAAMAMGAFVAGAQARHLARKFGAATVVIIGLGLEIVGVLTAALLLSPTMNMWLLAGLLAIYGVGLGLASAQLTSVVLSDVPTAQSGQGSATQSTVRQVGSALGAAIAGAVLGAIAGENLVRVDPEKFAFATQWALGSAVLFLVIGLVGALRLRRVSSLAAAEPSPTPREVEN